MSIITISKTFSGSNPYQLDDTSTPSGITSLYEALDALTNVTYIDSSYVLHEKGDVSATYVYSDSGTEEPLIEEFVETRDLFATSYSITEVTGSINGEPETGTVSGFIAQIDNFLTTNKTGNSQNFVVKDLHFSIDVTGQKRALLVFDANLETNKTYRAKIYSQNRAQVNVSAGDGPEAQFAADLTSIQANGVVVESTFVDFDVDPSGNRHILVIYKIDNS